MYNMIDRLFAFACQVFGHQYSRRENTDYLAYSRVEYNYCLNCGKIKS